MYEIFHFLRITRESDEFLETLISKYSNLDDLDRAIDLWLNGEQVKQLFDFLNELVIELLKKLLKSKNVSEIYQYAPILRNLLCNRTFSHVNNQTILGVYQIVGHEAMPNHLAALKQNIVYIDFLQSSDFLENKGISYPTFLVFNGIEFKTISIFESKHKITQHFAIPCMFFSHIKKELEEKIDLYLKTI